ncbi:hypothetical protein D3C85_1613700 [compost metagenome]
MATGALQLIVHTDAVVGLGDGLLQFFVARRMALARVGNGPGVHLRGDEQAGQAQGKQHTHDKYLLRVAGLTKRKKQQTHKEKKPPIAQATGGKARVRPRRRE